MGEKTQKKETKKPKSNKKTNVDNLPPHLRRQQMGGGTK